MSLNSLSELSIFNDARVTAISDKSIVSHDGDRPVYACERMSREEKKENKKEMSMVKKIGFGCAFFTLCFFLLS